MKYYSIDNMKKRVTSKQNYGESSPTSNQGETTPKSPSGMKLLAFLIFFRIVNALLITTWFVPDEFWQGPEVAHKLVFGYGYLTWEWKKGLRGFTFPLLFAGAFKILQGFSIDSINALIIVPRLVQAILAGFGDFFLYKLSAKLFGRESGKWTLLCHLLSWFTFYCITRSLTNSTETILTTIALYYWPWEPCTSKETKSNLSIALVFAAIACLIRPTSAIIWIPLALYFFIHSKQKVAFIFAKVLPIGILALIWSVCIDSWIYGRLTVVQWNFVMFNVVKDIGTFYGSHPWHWYFTQGFPVIVFTHFPLFCAGIYKSKGAQRLPALLILWVIIIYSFLSHKEFRFIFPILPLCMCYCGYCLSRIASTSQHDESAYKILKWHWSSIVIALLCITNIPVALYTSMVHQKGTIDVMGYIRSESQSKEKPFSVMFLMPCHSTPYYSYVHSNITMRFLECPPNETPGYVDEADQFFLSPNDWLEKQYPAQPGVKLNTLPTHLVFFDVLIEKIARFLRNSNYEECARFFHTHFPEGRIGKEVVVFCLK